MKNKSLWNQCVIPCEPRSQSDVMIGRSYEIPSDVDGGDFVFAFHARLNHFHELGCNPRSEYRIIRIGSRILFPLFELCDIAINLVSRPLDQIGMNLSQVVEIPGTAHKINIQHL